MCVCVCVCGIEAGIIGVGILPLMTRPRALAGFVSNEEEAS